VSNIYRWLWIGRPDLSMRPRSNPERPTQHGRLRFNGSEGVRSNLISAVRARLDGGAFSSDRWRRGRTHTVAAHWNLRELCRLGTPIGGTRQSSFLRGRRGASNSPRGTVAAVVTKRRCATTTSFIPHSGSVCGSSKGPLATKSP
jgi:hypothetical protein